MEYKTVKQIKAEQDAKRPPDYSTWTLKETLAWDKKSRAEAQEILRLQQEHKAAESLKQSGTISTNTTPKPKKQPAIIFFIIIIILIGCFVLTRSPDDEVPANSSSSSQAKEEQKQIEDEYNSLIAQTDVSALAYFESAHNSVDLSKIVTEVFVSGRYVDDSIEVLITIDKDHNFIQGEMWTFRNTAVSLLEDSGIISPDGNNKKIKVMFLWEDTATYKYTFEYGTGWSE